MEHPERLLGLFFVRPRRVLRRRRLHDGGAGRKVRRAVPVDAARRRSRRSAAGPGTGRGGVPRAPRARRAVRAADAGGHVRARDDRPQYAHRRRSRRVPVRDPGAEARTDAVRRVLHDGAGARDRDGGDCVRDHACAARPRTLRHPRRRGRGGSHGRPDLRLQTRRARRVLRARGRCGRHPGAVRVVRHRERYLQHHGAADGHPDERARRHAILGRPGDRRHRDHDPAVRDDGRRPGDRRQGRGRRDSRRGDPADAGRDPRPRLRAARPWRAACIGAGSGTDPCARGRRRRRYPAAAGRAATGRCCWRCAASPSRSRGCARSTASTSTCAQARSSA